MTRKQVNLIAIAAEHGIAAMDIQNSDAVLYFIPYSIVGQEGIAGDMIVTIKSYREAFAELGY